ncbi:M61 glycyl aminopeptidase [Aquisphaera giovannonii]|uniref:M61 glycyl aminopeptidase n=1 Tax=Aquisphaera giovannonii TaxID=406548 RepID=A0A5B9W3F6_9BACT|nr:M61 family metallopeptidase [Aquisphaera giovannonii]QEH35146.1 M61 glycyl aminopeptidase [Aquisphaera giovannonii]
MNVRQSTGASKVRAAAILALIALAAPGLSAAAAGPTLRVEVDARELPRRLIHTTVRLARGPGPFDFWYPRWIPGTHGPSGPLDTIGGLRVHARDGSPIPWRRDEVDLYRHRCEVPAGAGEVEIRLDTICNVAAEEASGHLSFGNAMVGIINWPTCLVYPDGPAAADIKVELSLRLPPKWKYATALRGGTEKDGLITFDPVSLEVLGDSPLIAGELLKTYDLSTGAYPRARFHVASESPTAVALPPDVLDLYGRMVREAGALFKNCHYDRFDFLVTCSDDLGNLGLEHLASSINGVGERDLIDARRRKGWIANLIPHEYVHSWCGKYRRPLGQCTPDFHTPMRTSLLWVYEGLTQYLGDVIMVRSGLATAKEYRETLTDRIGSLMLQAGRKWRPLEDTAIASSILRGGSPNWTDLRRSQDYYYEGALIWMEADAIIRAKTEGRRSLDDFARAFLGRKGAPGQQADPYERAEVVSLLKQAADHDWDAFLAGRVEKPLDALPLELVTRLGYRLQYSPTPHATEDGGRSRGRHGASAEHSLGLSFTPDGRVSNIVPGMPGDRAGLAPGMKMIGVNDRVFSPQRLEDALADSVALRKIDLLILEGDRFRTLSIAYDGGPKYLELVRDEGKPDVLEQIMRPIAR